jgi:hypothetical protein
MSVTRHCPGCGKLWFTGAISGGAPRSGCITRGCAHSLLRREEPPRTRKPKPKPKAKPEAKG